MTPKRKADLLTALNKEIAVQEERVTQAKETAKSYKTSSRSEEGDRAHFEIMADLKAETLKELQLVKKLVEMQSDEPKNKVGPICFVKLKLNNGKERDFIYADQNLKIEGFEFLTPNAPLGGQILGKSLGDNILELD